MNVFVIAWRNLCERALASTLTGLSMALGVAAVVCVIVINSVAVEQFEQDAQGYHFIVGGNGGQQQLVLSTVYHLGKPLFPVSYDYYREFVDGKFAGYTQVAVPYCLGDTYRAGEELFRVIGTTPDLFDKLKYDGHTSYKFAEGRNIRREHFFEAVVGSVAARQSGLKLGDAFNPTHGLSGEGDEHREFKVVGILAPTGTANDKAIFVNMEGFYLLEGHARTDLATSQGDSGAAPANDSIAQPDPNIPTIGYDAVGDEIAPLPEAQREVTSILVLCDESIPMAAYTVAQTINKSGSGVQAVAPTEVVTRLLDNMVGPIKVLLLVLTTIIVAVAAIGILVSIYNSMAERAHDIAVMRALGASRGAVSLIVFCESLLISMLGGLAGIVIGHVAVGLASPYFEYYTGVTLDMFAFDRDELWLLPGLLAASLVGFVPAYTAYQTDVAKALSGTR